MSNIYLYWLDYNLHPISTLFVWILLLLGGCIREDALGRSTFLAIGQCIASYEAVVNDCTACSTKAKLRLISDDQRYLAPNEYFNVSPLFF